MPKKIDDVIMPEKRRSIRNIPISTTRHKERAPVMEDLKKRTLESEENATGEEAIFSPPPRRPPLPPRRQRGRRRVGLAVGTAFLILVFALLSVFNQATLAYIPKSAKLTFTNEIYSAAKTGEGELLYSIVKLSGDKGKNVTASGEEEVSRKAVGTLVVYNNSTTDQRLIATTRFESSSGKIYRISEAILVPKKSEAGPGSVEAVVTADAAGADYNAPPSDFTVPGLKGSSRYDVIYARSKTPLSGGFIGKEKTVSESDLLKAQNELRSVLSQELLSKAQAEVPPDFILFPSLSTVSFEDLPQSNSGESGTATVNLRGHLYGIMFKRSELAEKLARNKIALGSNDIVDIDSFDLLKLTFNGTPPADLLPLNRINFKVEGTATVLWRTDEVALKSDLVGRSKKDVSAILRNYPTIVSAEATLRPFWKRSFPAESEKIAIRKMKVE